MNSRIKEFSKILTNRHFGQGVSLMMPLALPICLVGVLYGSVAVNIGFSPVLTVLLSFTIFSGAGQLMLIALVFAGASCPVILFSVFCLNLRYFAFGISGVKIFNKIEQPWRTVTIFGLTDEVFACLVTAKMKGITIRAPFAMGAFLCEYILWAFGAFVGTFINLTNHFGISQIANFVMCLLFLAMVLQMIQNKVDFSIFAIAGAFAVFGNIFLPDGVGIFIGIVIAVIFGGIWQSRS